MNDRVNVNVNVDVNINVGLYKVPEYLKKEEKRRERTRNTKGSPSTTKYDEQPRRLVLF